MKVCLLLFMVVVQTDSHTKVATLHSVLLISLPLELPWFFRGAWRVIERSNLHGLCSNLKLLPPASSCCKECEDFFLRHTPRKNHGSSKGSEINSTSPPRLATFVCGFLLWFSMPFKLGLLRMRNWTVKYHEISHNQSTGFWVSV